MNLLVIGFLLILAVAIIDFLTYNKKHGFIPASLTTSILIVMFVLALPKGIVAFQIGVFAFLISLLFTDLDLWGGWADFKIFIAGALAFPTLTSAGIFALSLTFCALAVKGVIVYYSNKKGIKTKSIPFVPVILLAYLLAWGLI
jgi:hypothetical protein